MFTSIRGNVAIVTGAASGAGLGVAKVYAKNGISVVITGRTESRLLSAKKEIEEQTPDAKVLVVVADNTNHDAAEKVVSKTIETFGKLNILVNCAQTFRANIKVEDVSWDDITAVYESEVFGAWRLMQAAFPYLKESQGTVINFASGADTTNVPHYAVYASNKAALRSITRIAAKEWGPYNINLNNVNPLNPSRESDNINDDPVAAASTEAVVNAIPMRRWGDIEKDVGSVCLFLALPEGHYLTGMTFDVDGGTTIRS